MTALIIAALVAQVAAGAEPAPKVEEATNARKVGQTTYLDVGAGAGYSSNPQLSVTSNSGRGYGRIDLHAVHARISERSTTVVSAYASDEIYTSRYGSQPSVSLDAHQDSAVSEQLHIFGSLNASYDENGQLDTRIIGVPAIPPLPGAPEVPPQLVPGGSDFLSIRGKHYRIGGEGGGVLSLSARDNLNFSAGVDHEKFKSSLVSDTDFTRIQANAGYNRLLSAQTTVGGQVHFENTDYSGPSSFRLITPQLTATIRLSEHLTFTGAAGVSFASIDDGIDTRHKTGFSGLANLCSLSERGSICVHVQDDQQTATTAGPAKTVSAGIDFSHRLTADSTIDLSVSGSHYSAPIALVTGHAFSSSDYFHAAAAYSHRLGNRWFGGINLAARKVTQNGPDPNMDFDGSIFIRYRFGDLQ